MRLAGAAVGPRFNAWRRCCAGNAVSSRASFISVGPKCGPKLASRLFAVPLPRPWARDAARNGMPSHLSRFRRAAGLTRTRRRSELWHTSCDKGGTRDDRHTAEAAETFGRWRLEAQPPSAQRVREPKPVWLTQLRCDAAWTVPEAAAQTCASCAGAQCILYSKRVRHCT